MLSLFDGRLKPGCENLVPGIEAELACELERVDWLPGFYAVPPQIKIASSEAYKSGKVGSMCLFGFVFITVA